MTDKQQTPRPEDLRLRLENQLCFPLYTAARLVTGAYTPFLKPLGLTYTQYVALLALWEEDGLSVGELGRRLHLDSGTLTPLLKRMEQDGLLSRHRSEADNRVVTVTLTESGRALKQQAAAVPEQVGACIPLPPEDAVTLYRLLYRIIGGMAEEA